VHEIFRDVAATFITGFACFTGSNWIFILIASVDCELYEKAKESQQIIVSFFNVLPSRKVYLQNFQIERITNQKSQSDQERWTQRDV